jgi:hypothetical protein
MADSKVTDLTELTSVDASDLLPIIDDPSGTPVTKKITRANLVSGLATTAANTFSGAQDLNGNNISNTNYQDFDKITAPADPSADHGRVYVKQIDANNDGIFIKIKKGGSFVEVQIA